MASRQSPTVKRRRLAMTLRRLREQAGLSSTEAARQVDHDGSWLSRIETAEVRPHPNDVRALLGLYGVAGEQAEAVIAVARQARQRGWWQRYSEVLPEWFVTYVGMESEASVIRSYQCQMVPGILQTEEYARAAFRGAPIPMRDSELEQQVALRMDRQSILGTDDQPILRMILDEAAVRRMVGGPRVLRAQLDRLITECDRTRVQIQILPFGAGAGFDGSFVILDFPPIPEPFPESAEDRLVYVGTLTGALYLEQPAEVAAYLAAFEQLAAEALPPTASRDTLVRIASDLAT
ncbi:helix-turn-helix transcriptional regulator [Solwaraspora sp. WMMA2080]|uniref:helix-turn-helix domain-containing protein n=2 Tax=Solwaraspora TaxID=265431 RepID=UPI00248CA57B|nr:MULTISPECIES: helix-turn-helix transcriptional regulator [unclassified Solwaraspora]WBB96559.1 helix-turn-helix transcriptional regulator [Solwaraspora sp. WMMA2059]WBC19536.1 helix-turn-helix transcriptional regulator [Solwaraspora sp. WMMA2080]